MKQLIIILFLGLITTTCQKSNIDIRNSYAGNWDFEVEYLSNQNNVLRSTVSNCSGNIIKSDNDNSLMINYCINDFLQLKVNEDGDLLSKDQNVGEITNNDCEITINDNTNSSVQQIRILGFKVQ
jgi:hypothetical protein